MHRAPFQSPSILPAVGRAVCSVRTISTENSLFDDEHVGIQDLAPLGDLITLGPDVAGGRLLLVSELDRAVDEADVLGRRRVVVTPSDLRYEGHGELPLQVPGARRLGIAAGLADPQRQQLVMAADAESMKEIRRRVVDRFGDLEGLER